MRIALYVAAGFGLWTALMFCAWALVRGGNRLPTPPAFRVGEPMFDGQVEKAAAAMANIDERLRTYDGWYGS